MKELLVSNPQRYILFLSNCWVGCTHDYRLLKEEFAPTEAWFTEVELHVDLGFYGIEKDYEIKQLSIPHKKPKKKPLTTAQKAENKSRASERVRVEHSIAGLKRYRI